MNYSIGDVYKFISNHDLNYWFIEEIVCINKDSFQVKEIDSCYGRFSPGTVPALVTVEGLDYFKSDTVFKVIRLNHRNSKLGKVLYK